MKNEISETNFSSLIYEIRGKKVMLDSDLAKLYGVETKRLKEQVRRNIDRFPGDFMFILNNEEINNLRSQFATSSWGGSRYGPMAFTEQGVATDYEHLRIVFTALQQMIRENNEPRPKIGF